MVQTVAVTGSIASDYLMQYSGRFADQLVAEALHRISLSFLVEDLVVRRGGIAANISFGMAQFGLHPVLVGAAGSDFDDYRSWLERHGVDCESVHISDVQYTARFFCTTDLDNCQIASFYSGAMSEAGQIELAPVVERVGGLDLVIVSPNDPLAMKRHTDQARAMGVPYVADPSQQLTSLEGPGIADLVDGAAFLVVNDYEMALIEQKTGWSHGEVLDHVAVCITTLGADGCLVEARGSDPIKVPAAPPEQIVDPTGVGDAFRAGFFAARARGLELERSAQVGSLLATYALETVGPQEYLVDEPGFRTRFESCFGVDAGTDLDQLFVT